MLKTSRHIVRFVWHVAHNYGGIRPLLYKAWAIYRIEGYRGILRRLPLARRAALDAAKFRRDAYLFHEQVTGEGLTVRPQGNIAVIVHAYYPDVLPMLVDALANIPWPFDLYISVTNETARQQADKITQQLKHAARTEIQIVPNRGRDIAPLLVTYAQAIRTHHYILHIHTKKSLYSGRERTEWREYLIHNLLGSEWHIRQIMEQFERYPELGIAYPDTFESIPYWAHTWLQNRGIALSLGAQLGIDITWRHYIDAPMGSMFWARSAALRPLLDLRLNYNDFPEEQGQTDGTLQHTIERFFVLAALHHGYNARAFLSTEKNTTLFFSPGRKNLEHYFAVQAQKRILTLASSADIISFDIFDTLLIRPWFMPDNLFAFLEEVVAQRFGITDFLRWRKEAEQLARHSLGTADVNITQIYQIFGELTGIGTQAKAILQLELETELATLSPRADICVAAQTLAVQNKRLVLVSDMYLDSTFLQKVLAKHKLDFFSALYVSNEIGARKDTGAMWQRLPEQEKIPKERWLHVGDNEHSDIQRPLDMGYLHPVHAMRAADQFLLFNEEASDRIAPHSWQEGLILGLLANRLFLPGQAATPIKIDSADYSVEISSLRDFGYLTIGPALTVFMAWLLDRAGKDQIELLLYASREGYLLQQAHEQITKRLKTKLPQGVYFLCSRAAAGLASADSGTSLEILLDAHFQGSFAELLQYRYCIKDLAPFTARLGDEAMHRPGSLPEDRARFTAQLERCFDLLSTQAKTARARYQRYAEKIIAGQRAALVDIGYGATIQKTLASFIDDIIGGYYFVTTDRVNGIEKLNQFASGCFGDRINPFHSDIPLYQYALLFEAVLTAPDGQLLGFDAADKPCFKTPGLGQKHFAQIAEIHAGALEFLDAVLKITGDTFFQLGNHHLACQLPIRQVMERRWRLAFDLAPLHVEDNFSGNEEISVLEFYDRKRQRLPGVLD